MRQRIRHFFYLPVIICILISTTGNSQTAQEYITSAASSFAAKNFTAAVQACNKALALPDNNSLQSLASVYKIRGMAFVELDSFSSAVQDFTACIKYDSTDQSSWYLRGNACFQLGQSVNAIKDFDRSLAIDPEYAAALLQKGRVEFTLKDYTAAIHDYTRYIQLEPKAAGGYISRGMIYIITKQKEAGCADLQKAAKLGDKSAPDLIGKFCK